mmetsp:Transcript_16688/g.46223  ORF Transcript_16688/g.46223 Transcript_16688/m.46223 type:complete len:337 (-) Transcript_16688:149-1159(-)
MCRTEQITAAPATAGKAAAAAADAEHLAVPAAPQSGLAALLASLADLPSVEARADAEMAELADASMRAMHEQAEEHRPALGNLLDAVSHIDRRETMDWLVQAFDVVGFSDGMLFQSALLMDRYHAMRPRGEVSAKDSQQILLTAVVVALKTESRDELQFSLRQVVAHLGRDKVSFKEFVAAELKMLKPLGFCVGTPTVHEFMEVLSTRISHYDHRLVTLAGFLLQLTLADACVHWGHPHAVLAASALIMAALTLQVPADAMTILLEDLRLLCPHFAEPASEVLRCCADLHILWVQSFSVPQSLVFPFAQHLRSKFAHKRYHGVASIEPPSCAPILA